MTNFFGLHNNFNFVTIYVNLVASHFLGTQFQPVSMLKSQGNFNLNGSIVTAGVIYNGIEMFPFEVIQNLLYSSLLFCVTCTSCLLLMNKFGGNVCVWALEASVNDDDLTTKEDRRKQ